MNNPKTLEEVKQYCIGKWQSISVELRPTEDRSGSGKIESTFLKRHFTFISNSEFIGVITLFADNYGQMPLMQFEFVGETKWGQAHAIADGAWEIDYIPSLASLEYPVFGVPFFGFYNFKSQS